MDTIPDKEFVAIFHRAAKYINFKGAVTPEILEERLKKIQKVMMKAKHMSTKESTKRKWNKKQLSILKLRQHGFAEEVINRSRKLVIVGASIRWGYQSAKQKLLEARKRRMSGFRVRRRG